jgi:hypothetical protein
MLEIKMDPRIQEYPVILSKREAASYSAKVNLVDLGSLTSSDVLQDMIVNVFEEGSENVIFSKERFLEDDEIIENLVVSVIIPPSLNMRTFRQYSIIQRIRSAGQSIGLTADGTFEYARLSFRLGFLFH